MQILSFPSSIQQLNSIWNSKRVRAAGPHFTPQALMTTFNSIELVMADSPKKQDGQRKIANRTLSWNTLLKQEFIKKASWTTYTLHRSGFALFLFSVPAQSDAQGPRQTVIVNSLWTSDTHYWAQSMLWSTVHDTDLEHALPSAARGTFSILKKPKQINLAGNLFLHTLLCLQILLLNAPSCDSTWYISPSACQLAVLIWC